MIKKWKILIKLIFLIFSSNTIADPVIVYNCESGYDINISDIENIYKFKLKKLNSQKLTIFSKNIHSLDHKELIMKYLQITPYQYYKLIDKKPVEYIQLNDDIDMVMNLKITVNSIAYIDSNNLYLLKNSPNLKVIN